MSNLRFPAARALAAAPLMCLATAAYAQVAQQTGAGIPTIVVTAQHLNEERSRIETQTGASTYTIDQAAIQATPGADDNLLNQLILRAPDAAQDSFGQLHIRGDHNGLQFRLNGIIIPEGISVFGQTLDPRLISSMKIVMGSLPAEFGLRTAGVIDLTTKSGALDPGGSVSLYGGSHGSAQPSFNYGGSSGSLTYFVSGSFLRNDLGIESPDGSITPLHDRTTQYHGFGYLEDILNEESRVTFLAGTSTGRFEIPNVVGLHSADATGLTVNGQSDFLSQTLNDNQREITHYGIASYQLAHGDLSLQTSLVARYSSLNYSPDPNLGDLFFAGNSQQAYKRDVAYGLQTDGAYHLNDSHTLRAGLYLQHDRLTSNTTGQVLPVDSATGQQTTQVPLAISDDTENTQWIYSLYLQDEWRLLPALVVNYGVRFDRLNAFVSESQVSPRINFVWQATPSTTVHAGYSRYFNPPPFELVGTEAVDKYLNTTALPISSAVNDPVKSERSNYYDLGVEHKLTPELTLGLDSYYKQATNLVDEGQFGAPIILTPFNYAHGQVYGVELTGAYGGPGPFSAYGNLAVQRAIGKDFISTQYSFDPADLAYVTDHYIHLDHEQQITASLGASYLWQRTRFSADMLVGSGLRTGLTLPDGSSIPNGAHLPYYRQVNLGIVHDFGRENLAGLTGRIDVINVFDQLYQIRDGSGIGVGPPQYGPRRGYFVGVSQAF